MQRRQPALRVRAPSHVAQKSRVQQQTRVSEMQISCGTSTLRCVASYQTCCSSRTAPVPVKWFSSPAAARRQLAALLLRSEQCAFEPTSLAVTQLRRDGGRARVSMAPAAPLMIATVWSAAADIYSAEPVTVDTPSSKPSQTPTAWADNGHTCPRSACVARRSVRLPSAHRCPGEPVALCMPPLSVFPASRCGR
jgi:hypothetical protein